MPPTDMTNILITLYNTNLLLNIQLGYFSVPLCNDDEHVTENATALKPYSVEKF